ncbi:MAG TPA: ribonuclease D [Steroidobacteraceae bacterium]|jgi:ribonuclease D|nr:ribonuclease D [Steroidobacteraceae bacterium]
MPDAIWIDHSDALASLAEDLEPQESIGLDTEFLRERTFFPKLCLLQLCAAGRIWCIDTLKIGSLDVLMAVLTAPRVSKFIHAARQDLEALYLTAQRVVSPVFDTQIAAACIGMKPQVGYADLVKSLLDVTIPKGQTRTDWSKRPLTRAQLEYAADDVLYLSAIAAELQRRLKELGREHWVREDCLELQERHLYEPDPAQAWERLRGIGQLEPKARARAKQIAVWREKLARERNLPRAWILPDAAIFSIAQADPATPAALEAVQPLNERFAVTLLAALAALADADPVSTGSEPMRDSRPTAEQKALLERLVKVVDARAAELQVSAEVLAPRGELKALAVAKLAGAPHDSRALNGWRREEIGNRLAAELG